MEENQSQPPAKLPESEEEQEKIIKLLEERLKAHDNNRKAVQYKLAYILNKLAEQVDYLEERIDKELEGKFTPKDDRLQRTLNELRGSSTISALQKAKVELSVVQSYEIIESKEPNNGLATLYELKVERRTVHESVSVELPISEESSSTNGPSNAAEMSEIPCDSDKLTEERERFIKLLEERLEKHDKNRKIVQDKLHDICEGLRAQVCELEDRTNRRLEEKFISEDNRLQSVLNELRGNRTASALQKVKAELLVEQSYDITENSFDSKHDLTTLYELKTERRIIPELTETKKPRNVRVAGVKRGIISVEFTFLNPDEERVLSDKTIVNPVKYRCLLFKKKELKESKEHLLDKDEGNDSFSFMPDILEAETTYDTRVKVVVGDRESEWSDDIAEFTTPEFKECCVWKKCPDDIDDERKYSVDGGNPRIATKVNDIGWCTIIGNTYIPLSKVTSWSIKILESGDNDGDDIYVGVAPNDIDQSNDGNHKKCGWYFYCLSSTLRSGPPHNYKGKEYGPRKEDGQYVHTGDSVDVVMDTTKGELSFVLNGVNLGVAYEGISLDKPLVPCVLLYWDDDSVELDLSEVKGGVDSSISVPSNIIAKSITWDTISLSWDEVSGASFYQIEVDGSNSGDASIANSFTKRGLLPEIEHSFRVRTVRGSLVSEWSSVVRGKTLKAPEFSECVWKECPDYVDEERKYSVDGGNPRIAKNISYDHCIIIGNAHTPPNTITSWNIKILKSWNDGYGIWIGIAPNDINQNADNICGWYFDCYYSILWSGPPHKYKDKEYGPRKEKNGRYVHTGDSVGVVVDTTRGDLSFVLNGVNLGVAFEGIPLNKPLVPCVVLNCQGDSVELII